MLRPYTGGHEEELAMSPRVVLADDHVVLRQGLKALLERQGLEAAHQIAQACPETRVILLTAVAHDRYVVQALRDGVRGFVVKTQAAEDLVQAIDAVCQGR